MKSLNEMEPRWLQNVECKQAYFRWLLWVKDGGMFLRNDDSAVFIYNIRTVGDALSKLKPSGQKHAEYGVKRQRRMCNLQDR